MREDSTAHVTGEGFLFAMNDGVNLQIRGTAKRLLANGTGDTTLDVFLAGVLFPGMELHAWKRKNDEEIKFANFFVSSC